MSVERDQRAPAPDRRRVTRGGRRVYDINLRDPDACPQHGTAFSFVVEPVRHHGFILRRHACRACNYHWESYQSLADPRRIKITIRTT